MKNKQLQAKLKYWIKSFFTLNKSEQRGIIVLFIIIVLISLFKLIMPQLIEHEKTDFTEFKNEIESFRNQRGIYYDSINLRKKQNRGDITYKEAIGLIKPFEFDPNTIGEAAFKELGFSQKQYKSIENYLKKGGVFRGKEDFKKMYVISDSEFEIVEDYIIISNKESPELKNNKSKIIAKESVKTKISQIEKPQFITTEINSTDSSTLVRNLKFKPWLARRIIKYRELLGGYYSKSQLLEVYGMPETYYKSIANFVEVDSSLISRLNINGLTFKELLNHPYFDYETTKLIFNSKPKNKSKSYSNFNDLENRTHINDSIGNRIRHYLYFGSSK